MNDQPHSFDAEELLKHATFVRRLARSLLFDEHTAADVTQDTWLAALRRPPELRFDLRAWLAGVTRKLAAQASRKQERRLRREIIAAQSERVPGPDELVLRVETLEQVVQAVKALDKPYRETVLLRFFDGLSTDEIALRTGQAEPTVRTRLRRALEQLRTRLDRATGGDRSRWCEMLLPFALTGRTLTVGGGGVPVVTQGLLTLNAKLGLALAAGVIAAGILLWSQVDSTHAPRGNTRDSRQISLNATEPRSDDISIHHTPGVAREVAAPSQENTCDRDLDLFGRVVNRRGEPLEGAVIQTLRSPWWRMNPQESFDIQLTPGPETRSANDGTFAIRLDRGEMVTLRASAPGYATAELPGRYAGEQVQVRLLDPVTLVVTVTDQTGLTLPEARVRLWRNAWGRPGTFGRKDLTTDDTGKALFAGLSPGEARVSVQDGEPRRVVLSESGTTSVEIRVHVVRTVSGVVTDGITGAPIAGARVGRGEERSTVTEADGRYLYPLWTEGGPPHLSAEAPGYGRDAKLVPEQGNVDFALLATDELHARILGADHSIVANASAMAVGELHQDGRTLLDRAVARTGPDGCLSLRGLRHDVAHTLVVVAPGHARFLLDVDPRLGTAGVICLGDLVLPYRHAIEGRIVDAQNKPQLDARVRLAGHNVDRGRLRLGARDYASSIATFETRGVDDLGRFRFPDLSPGRYSLVAETPNRPSVETQVELGPDKDVLDLVLELPAVASLTVCVNDSSSRPVPSAEVVVLGLGQFSRVITDDLGKALVYGAPGQELSMHAERDGYVSSRYLRVLPAGQEIALELMSGALVEGAVLSPESTPLDSMIVRVQGADLGHVSTVTDLQGRFSLLVPAGRSVDLQVQEKRVTSASYAANRRSSYRGEARGIMAPAVDVVIKTERVAAEGRLDARVTAPDGEPVAGVRIIARSGEFCVSSTTGVDGLAVLEGLPEHVGLATELPPGMPETLIRPPLMGVKVQGQTVELPLRSGVVVTGVVEQPSGIPLPGATVHIYKNPPPKGTVVVTDGDSEMFSAITDESGKFRVVIARPDRFDVWVEHTVEGGRKLLGSIQGYTDWQQELIVRLEWQ